MYKQEYKKRIKDYFEKERENYLDYLKEKYKKYKYICCFSTGNMGGEIALLVEKMGRKLDFYSDNNPEKVGKKDPYGHGIDVISYEELKKIKMDTVVIIPTRYYKEIYAQLIGDGFPMVDRVFYRKLLTDAFLEKCDRVATYNEVCELIDNLADEESCRVVCRLIQEWVTNEYKYGQYDDIYTVPQYFPNDIIKNNGCEIFVDCGAYIGDNIPDFIDYCDYKFEKYYAFELNAKSYEGLKKNIKENYAELENEFVLENKGISDFTHAIRYADQGEGSKLNEDGDIDGYVITLDDYFRDKCTITFVKMDIEGEEMNALRGGHNIISRCLPKLAICIYHKPEDLWQIPMYIKKTWSQYNIYIRHHTDLTNETVCYAVRRKE